MVVNARPLKRMKSRVTADLYDFLCFPSPTQFPGAFRTNVRGFLAKHAMMPPPSSLFPHLMTWQIQFRVGDESASESPESPSPTVVCLDIIEEDVARSRSIYCDQCRVVGWSGHPVCGKRYHFIIKADGHSIGGYHKPCICCGDVLHLSESKCKSCNLETNTDDVEDWVYKQLENTTHLLHGVIHSNGYGHLLRVNGREGGSRILSGRVIMDFWDRLCKALGARKVSVMDVSIKYGLEYRLLHSITKGRPWYGDWGYEFGAGSFALTGDAYGRSIETLSNLPLSIFISQEEQKIHPPLSNIISNYQSLSENKLVNVRDLFNFVLDLLHDARKKSSSGDVSTDSKILQGNSSVKLCSWPRTEVERVTKSMLRVLRAVSESNWVNRRTLKGALYKSGAPELLDHCLEKLGGKVASNGTVVTARLNIETNAFEYRLEPGVLDPECVPACDDEPQIPTIPSEDILAQDLRCLYNRILHPRTMDDFEPHATRNLAASSALKLLDCKQFVKDYEPEKASFDNKSNNNNITIPTWVFSCEAELVDETEETSTKPPPELVVLPRTATVADLKLEASKAFQDVYVVFRRFRADELPDHVTVSDDSVRVESLWGPHGAAGAPVLVRVRGRCHMKHGMSRFRMERGVERWTVECECGARDDDGERMSACDVCSVWHHTRCSGIPDSEAVPASFVCHRCRTACKDVVPKDGLVIGLTADVAL